MAVARYNPYSPYPIANARDPSLTSGETYHSGNFDKFSSYGSSPKITSFNGNGKPRFRGTYQRQFITEGSFQYNSPRNQVNKKGSNYASIANGGVTYEVPTNDYNQQNGVTNYGTTLTSDYGSAFGFHGFDTRAKYQSNGGTTQLTDYSDGNAYNTINNEIHKNGAYESLSKPSYLDPDGDSIIGEAGVDYPTFDEVPKTTFDCSNQQFPGMYGDTEAHCQASDIIEEVGQLSELE